MKQEEYLTGIKKQQSLIRKLFTNRKRRSEVIDELTRQRYGHLIGKFFKTPKGDKRFGGVDDDTTLYIYDVCAKSNYIGSDEVNIDIICRHISKSYNIDSNKRFVCGFEYYTTGFRFAPEDNLDEILAPLFIAQEKAGEEINQMYAEFVKNFLKKG